MVTDVIQTDAYTRHKTTRQKFLRADNKIGLILLES